MIIRPVDPRHHTWMNPTRIIELAGFADISDQRGFHHVSQTADDGYTPRTVPNTTHTKLVLIRRHTEKFILIVKTGSTLTTLDIGFGEQHKKTIYWFIERRKAPTVVKPLIRLKDATETRDWFNLMSSSQGEETLISLRPLLHPALCSLRDDIGGLLLWQHLILQVGPLITEGDTIIIEPQHQAQIFA